MKARDREGGSARGFRRATPRPIFSQEAGYEYLLDWCMDDQPVFMRTRAGRILAVPYPQEINDIPAIVTRKMNADDFAEMIIDNFDEMLEQAADTPLVMGIALHAYIVGSALPRAAPAPCAAACRAPPGSHLADHARRHRRSRAGASRGDRAGAGRTLMWREVIS